MQSRWSGAQHERITGRPEAAGMSTQCPRTIALVTVSVGLQPSLAGLQTWAAEKDGKQKIAWDQGGVVTRCISLPQRINLAPGLP